MDMTQGHAIGQSLARRVIVTASWHIDEDLTEFAARPPLQLKLLLHNKDDALYAPQPY